MYIIVVKLYKIYNTLSKYCWAVMDLMCQNVTLSTVSIVNCIKIYYLKTFNHEAYKLGSWSNRRKNRAYREILKSIQIFW